MFETFEQVVMPWHNPFNFLGFSHSIDHEKESKGKNNINNKMSVQMAHIQIQYWARIFKRLRSPGIDSASLCSLAGRSVR